MLNQYKIGEKIYTYQELKEFVENKLLDNGLVIYDQAFEDTLNDVDKYEDIEEFYDMYLDALMFEHEHVYDIIDQCDMYPMMTQDGPDMVEDEYKIEVCQYCGETHTYED